MRRFLSFILGLIFGIVFLLGTFGLAMYTSITAVHPNEVYSDLEKYLGDLGDVSLLQAYNNILKLYNDKTGGLTEGDLYSIGDFLADNNISTTDKETGEVTAFGIVMPKALLDAPLFEYFNNNVDENGHTGVQRALKQIKLSAVPSVVNMFTPAEGEKFISDEVTTELDNYSVLDLVYGENTAEGEAPNIVANLAKITENIKLVHLIPSLHTEEETENLIKTVLSAVGEASIGELITDLTSNNNIFGMLNADGSLREVGKLTFADILGENDPLISSMSGSISISDFIADNGNINITQALDKVSISGLFGLIKRPAEVEGATVVHYYKTAEEGAETYVWSVGEKDGKYYISTDANKEGSTPTWYEGMLVCAETHEHVNVCFDYAWYMVCKKEAHAHTDDCPTDCTTVEHSHDGEYLVGEKSYVPVEKTSIYRTIANLNIGALMDETGAINLANLFKKFDEHKLDTIVNELLADNESLIKLCDLLKLDEMTLSQLLGEGGFDKLIANVTEVPIADILKTFEVTGLEFITDMIGDMSINDLVNGGFDDIALGEFLGLIKNNNIDLTGAKITSFTTTGEEGETVVELSVATKVVEGQTVYYISTNYDKDADTTADDYVAPTWYEGQLCCDNAEHVELENHTKDCFEYVLYQKCTNDSAGHVHETEDALSKTESQEDGTAIDVWYVKANDLYNSLGNMTVGSIMEGEISSVFEDIKDMKLGELLEMFGINSDSTGIMNTLKNLTINDLMSGGYKSLQLGEILGYVHYENTNIIDVDSKKEHVDGENVVGYTATIGSQLVLSTNGSTWYNAKLTCEETHEHIFDCYGKVWYQECGEIHNHNENDAFSKTKEGVEIWYAEVVGLYDTLADMTIGSIMDGGFSSLFNDIKDIKLGELLKTFGMDGEMTGIMSAINDLTLNELMSGGYNSLLLGEILSYERNANDGARTGEVTFDDEGNMIGYVAMVGSQIVISADGTTWYNGKLACKTEHHNHVESCGTEGAYTCGKEAHQHTFGCYGYVWYQECTNKDPDHDHSGEFKKTKEQDGLTVDVWYVEATGMYNALAGLTIGDLTAGGDVMNTLLDKLTLGDVMKNGMPSMLESLKDTPISQLNGAIKTVKVGDFVGFKRSEVDVADWTLIETDVYQKDDTFAKKEGDKHYLAELTCEDATHVHTVDCYTCIWYAKDGVTPLSGVEKALADKVIDDLSDFKTILNDLTLGEVLSPVPDILKSIADTPINKLNTAIEGLYVGELLGYKKDADVWYKKCENTSCEHTDSEHTTIDSTPYVKLTGIEKVLAGKTINELKDLNSILNDVTLGDVMQDNLPDMLNSLKDVKIGELGTKMNDLYVGELLGYKKDADVWYKECPESCGHGDSEHTNIDGKYYVETTGIEKVLAGKTINELKDLNSILNDVTLGDVMQDNLPPMLKSLKDVKIGELSTEITKTKVGNLLEFTYDEETSCWKKDDGTGVLVELTGIEKVLADKSISELKDLNSIMDEVTLGDVMQDNLPTMLASLKDTPINELSGALDGLYVGEMLGYDRESNCHTEGHTETTHTDDCYKWTNGGTQVDGVMAKIANKKVGNLGTIGDDIQSYTIADILGKKDTDSPLIKALYDTSVGDISTKMNYIQLGTAMGYYNKLDCTESHVHDDACYKWYTDESCTTPVGAPQSAFVNSTLGNIGSDINNITLGKLVNVDGGSTMLKALQNTPINGIGDAINNMALGTAMGYQRKLTCTDTSESHVHSDDCYEKGTDGKFVWYEKCDNEGCTEHTHVVFDGANHVKVGAPQSAFVNSTLSGIGNDISNIKLGELVTINDESSSMLRALKDTPIDGISNAINTMSLGTAMGFVRREMNVANYTTTITDKIKSNGTETDAVFVKELDGKWYEAVLSCKEYHPHGADCYDFVWYEKCTLVEHIHDISCSADCTIKEHSHSTDTIISGTNYLKVTGLNAKMANLTVQTMNGNAFVTIVDGLSMRDLIDSGVLTFDEEEKYKLAIMSGCNELSTESFKCNMSGYFAYKISTPEASAEDFYKACHGITAESLTNEQLAHRDQWQDCTLNEFISALLGGI